MLYNLKAAMARKGITTIDLAAILKIHVNSVRTKIIGTHKFYFDEAVLIHQTYFEGTDIVSLFKNEKPI